jgi:hypothetical protein
MPQNVTETSLYSDDIGHQLENSPRKSLWRLAQQSGVPVGRGHAVAQAISRSLPNAVAQVRVRAACGVCCGQSSVGAGFLQILWFPLPIIPPISPSP